MSVYALLGADDFTVFHLQSVPLDFHISLPISVVC